MFSARLTLPILALLACGLQASEINASLSKTEVRPGYLAVKQEYDQKIEAFKRSFETNVRKSLTDTTVDNFHSRIERISRFIAAIPTKFAGEDSKGFLFYCNTEIKPGLLKTLQDMQKECTDRLANTDLKDSSSRFYLEQIIRELTELIKSAEDSLQNPTEAQSAVSAAAPAPLNPALQAQAAEMAKKIGQERPKANAVVPPVAVAPQAAPFRFTKKHWGIALIGIAALVGGMTVGQTKYKMFTRLFGKMPEKVVVPQLSWWGWFFKKAIFWR